MSRVLLPRWCSGLSCSPVEAATRVQIPVGAPLIPAFPPVGGLAFLFLGRVYKFYSVAGLGEDIIRWFALPGINISPVLSRLMSRCDEVFVSLWVGPVNGDETDYILLPRNRLNHVSRLGEDFFCCFVLPGKHLSQSWCWAIYLRRVEVFVSL